MVLRKGIEPLYPGCKPGVLPLNYRSKLVLLVRLELTRLSTSVTKTDAAAITPQELVLFNGAEGWY